MYLSVYMDVLESIDDLKNTKIKKNYRGGVLRFIFNKSKIIKFFKTSWKN